MSEWQLLRAESAEQARRRVLAVFQHIREQHFTDTFILNQNLPVTLRGWQERGGWYEGLLLTPWMLAHLYVPQTPPPENLPEGWDTTSRRDAPYTVIGPTLDFDIGEERPIAHINYDPLLGHYCLQPLVQSLNKYPDADAVYAAWDGVLAARQASRQRLLEEHRQQQQEPVSRRAFMTRWLPS